MSTTSERMARVLDAYIQVHKDCADACKTCRRAILVHADDGIPTAAFEALNAARNKAQQAMAAAEKDWLAILAPAATMRDRHVAGTRADMVILDDPVRPDTPETVAKRIKVLQDFYASEDAALRAKTMRRVL